MTEFRRKERYYHELVIIAVIIGVFCGLTAIMFSTLLNLIMQLFLEVPVEYTILEPNKPEIPNPPKKPWLIPLIVTLGGLLAGIIVFKFAPEAEGHGTDAAIAAFHRFAGKVRARVPLVKMVASAITIGSGGSAGREGPMAQIGAGIGSKLASILKFNTRMRRIALVTGIGAGIGTIFKAPLGGAIFALEVLYKRDFEVEALLSTFIASSIGYAIYGVFAGWEPVFKIPSPVFQNPIQLIFYSMLGIASALVGVLYVKAFFTARTLFRQMRIPKFCKPAVGGLLTGIIGMFIPQVLETSYGWITLFTYGIFPTILKNGSWVYSNSWSITALFLVLLALAKIAATSFTIGSGGSGGVFAPGLTIGASIGAALGITFMNMAPNLVGEQTSFLTSAIVIGAMSLFAAVSKAPIAVLIMVSEMTKTYELIAPAMLSIAIAYFLSGDYTIYPEQVENRAHSPAHAREFHRNLLNEMKVKDAMKTEFPTLKPEVSVEEALRVMARSGLRGIPVVSEGELVGIVAFEDITNVPKDLRKTTKVEEIMNRRLIVAYPDETLYEALKAMTMHNVAQLPVVKHRGSKEIVGILTRRDIIEAHDRMVLFIFGEEET